MDYNTVDTSPHRFDEWYEDDQGTTLEMDIDVDDCVEDSYDDKDPLDKWV